MFCPSCGSNNNDQAKFCRSCGKPIGQPVASQPPVQPQQPPTPQQPVFPQQPVAQQPVYAQPTYAQPTYAGQPLGYQPVATVDVPTRMAMSIVTVVCCCLPLGIVGIIMSSQVKSKLAAGDVAGAQKASKTALTCNLIGIFGGLIIYAVFILNALIEQGVLK